MSELWLPVSGYETMYEVSNKGRVRSIDRVTSCGIRKGRILRQTLLPCGYLEVSF